jgi:hypothetical protein
MKDNLHKRSESRGDANSGNEGKQPAGMNYNKIKWGRLISKSVSKVARIRRTRRRSRRTETATVGRPLIRSEDKRRF